MSNILARLFVIFVFFFYVAVAAVFFSMIVRKWVRPRMKRRAIARQMPELYHETPSSDQSHQAP